jgi:hypothetical protein
LQRATSSKPDAVDGARAADSVAGDRFAAVAHFEVAEHSEGAAASVAARSGAVAVFVGVLSAASEDYQA